MRNISVSVDKNGYVSTNAQQLGYSGEHNAVTLTVSFTDDGYDIYSPCEYFRIIIDGNYSDELYMENKLLSYSVPQQCMTPPVVHGQLVGYTTTDGEPTAIIKSEIFEFEVDRSQVPHEKVSNQPDVFERALAECKNAAEGAENNAETAVLSAQEAKESAEISKESQTLCENYAAKAESIADKLEQREVDLNNLSNALKGSVSGSEVVLPDVSPLEHELAVKLSGDFSSVSTETVNTSFSQKGDTLMLPSPVSSVTVNIPNPGAYIVGVIVPIIDGVSSSDLLANAAIPIQYAYGEAGPIMELQYSVSGSVVSWSGLKNWSGGDEASKVEISGSYDTGASGIAISGFVQPYGLDEDNPYFQTPQYDSISFDISATVTVGTPVKVFRYGKNLFDVSKIPNINGITNNGDGTLTLEASKYTFTTGVKLKDLCPELKAGDVIYLSGTTNGVPVISFDSYIWHFNSSITVSQNHLNGRLYIYGKTSSASDYDKPHTISNIQIELGDTATDYMPYVEPTEYTPNADGTVDGITSLYPTTILSTDTDGVTIDCEYNRDINKAFAELHAAIISLGGNV